MVLVNVFDFVFVFGGFFLWRDTDCVFLCVFGNVNGYILKIHVLAVVQLFSLKTAWSDYLFFVIFQINFTSVKFGDRI